MDYYSFSALFNFLISISFGIFIVYKNSGDRLSRLVAFWCFVVFFWSFFYFLWQISATSDAALLFVRILMVGAIVAPLSYLKVVVVFLNQEESYSRVLRTSYAIGVLFLLLLPSPYMVQGIHSVPGFDFWPTPGPLYLFFLVYFFYLTALSIFLSVKSLRSETSLLRKSQIRLMLFGIALAIFGGSTNYFLWYGIDIPPFGNILVSSYVILTAYAIIKHHLMDIKLVLRKYSVYIASLGSVTVVVAMLKFLGRKVGITHDFLDIVILAGAVSLFLPLKNYFYRFANTYLFSSLYDARAVIASLSNRLRSTLDSQKIYQYISEALQGAFHAKSFAILLFDEKKGAYRVAWRENFAERVQWITLGKKTCSLLLRHDKPLFLEDGDDTRGVDFAPLRSLGIVAVNPLNLKDKCVGLIVMGAKESGDMYNDDDFGVLDVVGTQAAIAIENARLYEEAQEFNAVLQDKVHKATHKLRTQNAKLKQLDQMKTEFISIASHQLRTPLTATRWALDFLKKGRDGKLSKDQKETVEELSTVNQKLIRLVNDLLNVSRIDENRIRIDPKPTDVVAMLRETMKEYMPIAEHKRLKVVEKYDDIPMINLDENVIAKAISNFLSNAVKYDRDGRKLWITVEKEAKSALITIRDEGIGIPKGEQDHIFQKFYRASNAAASQTEGTGLGLYIAKSAIEKSGGSVWFESIEGKGTTFFVRLPFSGSRAVQGEKSLS